MAQVWITLPTSKSSLVDALIPVAIGSLIGVLNLTDGFQWMVLPALTFGFCKLDERGGAHSFRLAFLFVLANILVTWHWVFSAVDYGRLSSAFLGISVLLGIAVIAACWVALLAAVSFLLKGIVVPWITLPTLIALNTALFPIVTGLPFPPISLALIDTPLSKIAHGFGQPGLSFVTLFLAGVASRYSRNPILISTIASLGLAFTPVGGRDEHSEQRIALVQTGGVHGATLLGLLKAADAASADLILLPENALGQVIKEGEGIAAFEGIATPIVFSGARQTGSGGGKYATSMFVYARGTSRAVYDKRHLVPFYETNVLREVFGGRRSLLAGEGAESFEYAPGRTVFPMLCFEVLYPIWRPVRANVIVLLASDWHFTSHLGQRLLLKFARLRSIEAGRPVVRVSDVGFSAMTSSQGNLLEIWHYSEPAVRLVRS